MKLSLNEKQTFYHELGRFAQSGMTMPQAAESLAADSGGSLRRAFNRLSKLFLGGESVSGAFAQLQPAIGAMEVALIEASDRSGRLDQAFQYLSSYFVLLCDTVRAGIIKRALWPVIQLHLGVVMLNFAGGFVEGTVGGGGGFGFSRFVVQCVSTLGLFYVLTGVLVGGGLLLTRAARTSVAVDRALSLLPMIGKLRRNLALTRFCASYEMQLSAGVNVMDSVRAAGEASQSARVRAEVARMRCMAGVSIGTLVVGSRVFPSAFQRSVRTGEATGTLDADLRRWAEHYQKAAIDSLEAAGAWLSRIVSFGILLYLGYKIVMTYSTVMTATYNQAGLNE